jgi:simple sugar transport system substrate-binding protein
VRRLLLLLAALVAAALVAGCGRTTVVHESTLVARDQPEQASPETDARAPDSRAVRIAMITHGQASSPFWAIVRHGAEDAAHQTDVILDYRSPAVYSLSRMKEMIAQAVATHPDGLAVSVPEPGLSPAIRRAVKAGIPVISLNSGSTEAKKLGVLAHVGQPEERAGYEAGLRLAAKGVHRALCVNQQVGNQGLDARCAGLARAMRKMGGTSRVLAVDDQSAATPGRISAAVRDSRIEGVLCLNSTTGLEAVQGLGTLGQASGIPIGTFDLGPDVLRAVQNGRLAFAIDQQAYLQGYLPVTLLANRARYGLFPARHRGSVIPTGPHFVTAADAARVIELSKRSYR